MECLDSNNATIHFHHADRTAAQGYRQEVNARRGNTKDPHGHAGSVFRLIVCSIFLPLKLGTAWFYAGLAVYILGIVISCAALLTIAATEPGEPFTTGMYRYSRHPLALGTLLPMIGAGIASASWLFLLLSAILMVISHSLATTEERAIAKKFGDAYEEYLARTPRWLGLPRSGKG
jgi:protein-S-isoprenylcysteine O-methyltransferase Ste14